MDTSLTQACVLAAVKRTPGISGPELAAEVGAFIPLIQFHQHLARLRKRGLIVTERHGNGSIRLEISLTPEGEAELARVHELAKFVVNKCRKT